MDLKWLLVRRITLVALACFVAGSGIALYVTAREVRRHNTELAGLAGRHLDLQLARIARSTDVMARFPDWDIISTYALEPGQCIEFRGANASSNRSSCSGYDTRSSLTPPHWFLEVYRNLINDRLTESVPIDYRGAYQGTLAASYDAEATAAKSWATIAPLLGLSAALVAALCVVTYFVVDRALRPTREILDGLNRLARGNLDLRLPSYRLRELDRISEVINALSEELSNANAERSEFARRLVDSQEQERRHIARELHDEIAQRLAGLNAVAACLRTSAQTDAPALVSEARELEKMATDLMRSIRHTLTYLRPQEIDDLGLIPSLRVLVEQHNEKARGTTTYSFETEGEMEVLRAETSAHVYRIVQEALTNASKHANARNVKVILSQDSVSAEHRVRLSVVDDGAGAEPASPPEARGGAGLIGMRERVIALSGKFAAGPRAEGGFGLEVEFPTLQHGA